MISTATALSTAYTPRGSGPTNHHTAAVSIAMPSTARTNHRATLSARRCVGARLRCACATICTICASTVCDPIFSARMTRLPVPLIVAPMTRPPAVFSTGIGSPVSIDSSTLDRPSMTTPSTGTFSPGRIRKHVTDVDVGQRDVFLAAVVANAARGLGLKAEQRLDRSRRRERALQLEHLTQQRQRHDDRGRLEVDGDAAHLLNCSGKMPGATVASTL